MTMGSNKRQKVFMIFAILCVSLYCCILSTYDYNDGGFGVLRNQPTTGQQPLNNGQSQMKERECKLLLWHYATQGVFAPTHGMEDSLIGLTH
jgi:hypothetical protein